MVLLPEKEVQGGLDETGRTPKKWAGPWTDRR